MMEAGVSVVLPTYNRAGMVQKAVESVLAQTYKNFELIIVDDASTDNTEDVVGSIKDDRIRYYKLETNKGPAGARNEGVEWASYDLVAFQDSDDEWLPKKLEKQVWALEHAPAGVGMVYHPFYREGQGAWPKPQTESFYRGNIFQLLLYGNVVDAPAMFLRRAAFLELGGFAENLRCLEDYEFALRFAYKYKIEFVNEVLLHKHVMDEGVNSQKKENISAKLYIIGKWKQEMLSCRLMDQNALEYNVNLVLALAQEYGYTEETTAELKRILDIR